MRKIFKSFLPFILRLLYLKLRGLNNNYLFDGDDSLFKKEVSNSKVYGEYGCGKSTKWTIKNTDCIVLSVDTSNAWIKKIETELSNWKLRLKIHHCDLGTLAKWGTPVSYEKKELFPNYTDFLWKQPEKPDTVLIDGRFRVCCFLTTLKLADEGTRIIFDDYINRPHYHFIEKYVPRITVCGRQCLFIVPPKYNLDINELSKDIESFRFVMD